MNTDKSLRGFARMSVEARAEIARKGGLNVPAEKRSFSVNKTLASSAGRLGGQSVKPENRSFSKNRELAANAGKKGGTNCKKNKEKKDEQVD